VSGITLMRQQESDWRGLLPARVVHQYNAMRPETYRKLANARLDPIELNLQLWLA
jgi:hypothetical protein